MELNHDFSATDSSGTKVDEFWNDQFQAFDARDQ